MHKRQLIALSLVSGLALSATIAVPANAAAARPKVAATKAAVRPALPPVRKTFTAEGTVAAVDAVAASITINRTGAGGLTTSATIAVASDAVVTVDGVVATLADVPAGARVRLGGTVTSGISTATKVQATTTWPFKVDSTVSAVDADAATITVVGYNPVPIAPTAAVTVDGVVATLADVPAGARVRLAGTVTNGNPVAAAVTVTTTWSFKIDGKVSAVDAIAATISVLGAGPIPVASTAVIKLNSRVVALEQVPAGAGVRVSGTVVNGASTATRIEATVPVRKVVRARR